MTLQHKMHGSEDLFVTIGGLECVSKLLLFFFRYKVYGTRFRKEARIFMSYLMLMKSVFMALQYFTRCYTETPFSLCLAH
jgi:hypothetical protein